MLANNQALSASKLKSPIKQHQLYQKALLEHHKNPIGFQSKITIHGQSQGHNAACGDEITVAIEVENETIKALSFHGDSCAICRASASLLCFHLTELTLDEGKGLGQKIMAALDNNIAVIGELAEQFSPLLAVQQFPVRKQCAILPWVTFSLALENINEVR
ncbi:iron-sulfur cluster assembly scaffold protein [bacterium]|nr:iron-sulfur cluster assembly scaffold protein [bacterium]